MRGFKVAVLGSLFGGWLLLLCVPSQAAPWGGGFNHGTLGNDIRSDRRKIQRERSELYDDRRDLSKDRRELRQDLRDGASPAEISRDRHEIRKDRSDIANERQDLTEERRDLRQDLDHYDRERDQGFFSWWHSWWNRR